VTAAHLRLDAVERADLLLVHVDVDVRRQLLAAAEDHVAEARVLRLNVREHFADVLALDEHLLPVAGEAAKRRRNVDRDGHVASVIGGQLCASVGGCDLLRSRIDLAGRPVYVQVSVVHTPDLPSPSAAGRRVSLSVPGYTHHSATLR